MSFLGRVLKCFTFVVVVLVSATSCGKKNGPTSDQKDPSSTNIDPVAAAVSDAAGGLSGNQSASTASFTMTDVSFAGSVLPAQSSSASFTIVVGAQNAN